MTINRLATMLYINRMTDCPSARRSAKARASRWLATGNYGDCIRGPRSLAAFAVAEYMVPRSPGWIPHVQLLATQLINATRIEEGTEIW